MSLRDKNYTNHCRCVTKHIPLPVIYVTAKVGEEYIHLCPTAKANLELYIDLWNELGSEPPGYERKHYSEYIQTLAKKSMGV